MAEPRRPCSKCGRNRAERFFASSRARVCADCKRRRARRGSRDQHLRETYGLTAAEYEQILEAQGGVCAICKGKRRRPLDVDHDHEVERTLLAAGVSPTEAARRSVRGLLCPRCNRRLLPASLESPDILRAAIVYLDEARWRWRVQEALLDQ